MNIIKLFFVATCLFSAGVFSQSYVGPWLVDGMDIILNNGTSFFNEVGFFRGGLYVSGNGYIHQLLLQPKFELSYYPWFRTRLPLLDFDTFVDVNNNSWIFGSVANRNNSQNGLNYPLLISGVKPDGTTVGPVEESLPGNFLMSACSYGNTSTTNVYAGYFVGWEVNATTTDVGFSFIRTIIDPNNVLSGNGKAFGYEPFNNRVELHADSYNAYTSDNKPWIFHSSYRGLAIVVDPNTHSIYRIFTPADPTHHLSFDPNADRLSLPFNDPYGTITGATYDYYNEVVYLGFSNWGTHPGAVVAYSIVDWSRVGIFTFGDWESNPKGLAFGDFAANREPQSLEPQSLYVSFLGGTHISKIDISTSNWAVRSYATLPTFMTQIWSIVEFDNSLIAVTNDQYAKVVRIPLSNFCAKTCDSHHQGYCFNGQCLCGIEGTVLEQGTTNCIVPKVNNDDKKEKKEHHGEVALGLLFALAFILACVGWYLFYKQRGGRSPYAVFESSGLLQRK